MADMTVTAASVRPLNGCKMIRLTAGATITPGQPVYMSGNRAVTKTAGGAVATARCIGVVVSDGSGATSFASGTEVDVVTWGPITGFATYCAAGAIGYVSDTAGSIGTTKGSKTTIVGVGLNATDFFVNPKIVSLS